MGRRFFKLFLKLAVVKAALVLLVMNISPAGPKQVVFLKELKARPGLFQKSMGASLLFLNSQLINAKKLINTQVQNNSKLSKAVTLSKQALADGYSSFKTKLEKQKPEMKSALRRAIDKL